MTSAAGGRPQDYFQAISLHHYSFAQPPEWAFTDLPGAKGSATQFSIEEYYQTVMNAQRMDELITRHSTIMDCYDPSRRIGLVVDEWGTWFDVEPGTNPGFLFQQNTLRDALVAGLHFDIFHRHAQRLVMANLAQTVNVLQSVLHTDGAQLILTPTYHVFEMNKRHHDATRLGRALRVARGRPTRRRLRPADAQHERKHQGRNGAPVAHQPGRGVGAHHRSRPARRCFRSRTRACPHRRSTR